MIDGIMTINYNSLTERPTVKKPQKHTWNAEQMKKFLDFVSNKEYYIIYLLEMCTGLRTGELLGLQYGDVDFSTGMINIERERQVQGVEDMLKTDSSYRNLSVPQKVVDEITKSKNRHEKEYLKLYNSDYIKNNFICKFANGKLFHPEYPNKVLQSSIGHSDQRTAPQSLKEIKVMGEYAEYKGERIKIGTCEDMYYLRADQAHLVKPLSGNVSPASVEDQKTIRFRFPWPSEDGIEPGAFGDYSKGRTFYDLKPPEGVEHYTIQFSAPQGYLVSLPCPEGPEATHGLRVHRNGWPGAVSVVQQAYRGGVLALICRCACGAAYNLPTLEDAQPVIDACLREAEKNKGDRASYAAEYLEIAKRIRAGYEVKQPALTA